jgi:DNA-binding transcriptional MerR regulator
MPPKYHGAVFQSAGQLAVFKAKTPTTSTLRIPKNAFEFMSHPAVVIPEKLFFKIGEVCELAGVQAHVLRYWESEFPMLAPQKNRAGQRVYRKRDVEIALRIKELLYEDQYTIAGAKKRLANDLRGGKLRPSVDGESHVVSGNHNNEHALPRMQAAVARPEMSHGSTAEDRQALKQLAAELREILSLLETENKASASSKK